MEPIILIIKTHEKNVYDFYWVRVVANTPYSLGLMLWGNDQAVKDQMPLGFYNNELLPIKHTDIVNNPSVLLKGYMHLGMEGNIFTKKIVEVYLEVGHSSF